MIDNLASREARAKASHLPLPKLNMEFDWKLLLSIASALGAGTSAAATLLLWARFRRLQGEIDLLRQHLKSLESLPSADQDKTRASAQTRPSAREIHRLGAPGSRSSTVPRADVPTLIKVPNLARKPHAHAAMPAGTLGDLRRRHAAVLSAAEQGRSPEAIARATGVPIGQVELILGLRDHLESHTNADSGTQSPPD